MPATNGLLENTDSHASQLGELGREGGRIWKEAEGRVVSERDGGRHAGERVVEKEKIKSSKVTQWRKKIERVEEKRTQCVLEL